MLTQAGPLNAADCSDRLKLGGRQLLLYDQSNLLLNKFIAMIFGRYEGRGFEPHQEREIMAFKKKVQGAGLFLGRSSGYRRGPSPEQGDYPHW